MWHSSESKEMLRSAQCPHQPPVPGLWVRWACSQQGTPKAAGIRESYLGWKELQLFPTPRHRQGHLPLERCYDGNIPGMFPYLSEPQKVNVCVSSNEAPQMVGDLSLYSVALRLWKKRNISSYLSGAKGGQSCDGLGSTQTPEWQVPEEMTIENDSSCLWSRLSTARNKPGTGPPTKLLRQMTEKLIWVSPCTHLWHGRAHPLHCQGEVTPMLQVNHGWAAGTGVSLLLLSVEWGSWSWVGNPR